MNTEKRWNHPVLSFLVENAYLLCLAAFELLISFIIISRTLIHIADFSIIQCVIWTTVSFLMMIFGLGLLAAIVVNEVYEVLRAIVEYDKEEENLDEEGV